MINYTNSGINVSLDGQEIAHNLHPMTSLVSRRYLTQSVVVEATTAHGQTLIKKTYKQEELQRALVTGIIYVIEIRPANRNRDQE